MLLPHKSNPKDSIYYNAANILEVLLRGKSMEIIPLFLEVKKRKDLTFPLYLLCLDWLYLIDAAEINEQGSVVLCL